MRYRGSSKIKYEHSMIAGLRAYLESIEAWPEIKSIITGRIEPKSGGGSFHLTVQYETKTGLKCLAKSGNAVQEVFFVSPEPTALREKLAPEADKKVSSGDDRE